MLLEPILTTRDKCGEKIVGVFEKIFVFFKF